MGDSHNKQNQNKPKPEQGIIVSVQFASSLFSSSQLLTQVLSYFFS